MSITIAIPFYNAEKYLEQSIKSVFAQSYQDWELLLIDDGSSDRSLEIAKSINDPRVRVISDGKNKKLAFRLNQIITEAKFSFIARMDADDIMPTFRLESQYNYLKSNPDIDLVTTGLCSLNKEDKVGGCRVVSDPELELNTELLYSSKHNIVHASVLVRKSWYLRNAYDVSLPRSQDYELWIRAFINNDLNIGFLPIIGYYYREELSLTEDKMLNAYWITEKILNKYRLDLNNVFKKKLVLYSKILLVRMLSKLSLLGVLLKRRSENKAVSNNILCEISKEIESINKIILPKF